MKAKVKAKAKVMDEGRLRHALHVLRNIKSYLKDNPEEASIEVKCKDGLVSNINPLILAAFSPVMKKALLEAMTLTSNVVILAPSLLKSDVDVFHKYLFADKNEVSHYQGLQELTNFCHVFDVKLEPQQKGQGRCEGQGQGQDSGFSSSGSEEGQGQVRGQGHDLKRSCSVRRRGKVENYVQCPFCPRSFRYLTGTVQHNLLT